MKELFLVRHAKSDWGTEFLKDIDRPLNERGYRDAYFMSQWFLKNKKAPQRIVSSTATRALNTALIFARAMDFDLKNFTITPKIYECHEKDLRAYLKEMDNSVDRLMVFCHNPCITEASNRLTKDVFIDNVPTCGIVNLNFEVQNWKDIEEKKASIGFFQFPKDFKNTD
jgi:phosphohistidine phosphatase